MADGKVEVTVLEITFEDWWQRRCLQELKLLQQAGLSIEDSTPMLRVLFETTFFHGAKSGAVAVNQVIQESKELS